MSNMTESLEKLSPVVDVLPSSDTDVVLVRRTKGSGMSSKDPKYFRPEIGADGRLIRTQVSNYDKEELPLTKQTEIIFWHVDRQEYTFDINDDALNKLVELCGFAYPDKYVTKVGEPIIKCNRNDRNDAFVWMMNRYAKFQKEEGEGKLDRSKPRQAVMASHLATRNNYISPKNANDPNLNSAIYNHMLVSTTHETHSKYAEFKLMQETNIIWAKLDDRAKRDIAKLCRIQVTANTTHEVFEPLLYAYATSKDPSAYKGKSKQEHFYYLATMSSEDFQFEMAIHLASIKGFLKNAGPIDNQYYTLFNKPVGNKLETVREYLRNPENQEEWQRLCLLVAKN